MRLTRDIPMESAIELSNPTKDRTYINVLVADDDPPTRALLKAAITQWGYTVTEASDGEEAWEIISKTQNQHIVILDWIMPKLDGIGLCERIKNSDANKPYIILLTQVTGTTNIVRGLEAGADEFLSKPFNMAELHSRLSVGARIINSEKILNQQNINLSEYIKHITQFTTPLLQTIEKISSLLENDSLNLNPDTWDELRILNKKLKKNLSLFTKLHLDNMKK